MILVIGFILLEQSTVVVMIENLANELFFCILRSREVEDINFLHGSQINTYFTLVCMTRVVLFYTVS